MFQTIDSAVVRHLLEAWAGATILMIVIWVAVASYRAGKG